MSPVGFTDPSAFIMSQLLASARDEPVDQDALEDAATLVAAANLHRAGLSYEALERLFNERDHTFRLAIEDGDLVVEVKWDDEEGE